MVLIVDNYNDFETEYQSHIFHYISKDNNLFVYMNHIFNEIELLADIDETLTARHQ